MKTLDICFSPELLPLYDLKGRVAVVVDVLRATSSIVTALAQGVTHLVPVSELDECRALAAGPWPSPPPTAPAPSTWRGQPTRWW
jgi:2-phosphosulfolactate phosphatase